MHYSQQLMVLTDLLVVEPIWQKNPELEAIEHNSTLKKNLVDKWHVFKNMKLNNTLYMGIRMSN